MNPPGPEWREPRLYSGYARRLVHVYEEEPVIQVSLQLILSVFTVAFFIFFAIRPTLETIVTLQKKIKDQQSVNVKLDTKLVQLVQAQDQLALYADDLPKINRAVPNEVETRRVAAMIEGLANENNVWISAIDIQGYPVWGVRETGKGDKFVTFSVTAGGTQTDLISFLGQLENLERAIGLTQVSFSKPTGTDKGLYPLTVLAKGTMYYQPASITNAK